MQRDQQLQFLKQQGLIKSEQDVVGGAGAAQQTKQRYSAHS
jgi:hypothetical protein